MDLEQSPRCIAKGTEFKIKDGVDPGSKTTAPGPNPASCLLSLIKFYWHMATPLGFLVINSGFPELRSFNGDHLACRIKNIYSRALYRSSLPPPGIENAAICMKRK